MPAAFDIHIGTGGFRKHVDRQQHVGVLAHGIRHEWGQCHNEFSLLHGGQCLCAVGAIEFRLDTEQQVVFARLRDHLRCIQPDVGARFATDAAVRQYAGQAGTGTVGAVGYKTDLRPAQFADQHRNGTQGGKCRVHQRIQPQQHGGITRFRQGCRHRLLGVVRQRLVDDRLQGFRRTRLFAL